MDQKPPVIIYSAGTITERLTVRDQFAMRALRELIVVFCHPNIVPELIAAGSAAPIAMAAYEIADAMMAERSKEKAAE